MRKKLNIVLILIIINAAIFIIVNLIGLIGGKEFLQTLVDWLAVPSSLKKLLLRFWTPFTYMFLHESFWHIGANMLWLFFLGKIFIEFIEEKNLLAVYLLGGLSGAALYILIFNVFNNFFNINSLALGASASISAIVIAICVYKPNFTIRPFAFFNLKLKWLAIIFVAIDVLSIFGQNAGGHIAHLGGAAFGLFFGYQLKKGTDVTAWLTKIFDYFRSDIKIQQKTEPLFKQKPKMDVNFNSSVPKSDYDYNKMTADRQEEMDRILDKISKSGYNSLSNKEKDFLFSFKDE